MPTPLDHIWNGWRAAYVQGLHSGDVGATHDSSASGSEGAGEHRSVFRRILDSGLDDAATNIIVRGPTCFVILNAFPYTVGHMLILPYRQVPTLDGLTATESTEIWGLVHDGVAALNTGYQPAGINVGLNMGQAAGGSVSEHLHFHVLPRWVGDANFTTTVANARTIPEPLDVTANTLRAAWPRHH